MIFQISLLESKLYLNKFKEGFNHMLKSINYKNDIPKIYFFIIRDKNKKQMKDIDDVIL